MNGYMCTKAWYSFAYENPRLIKPIHHAIIHWIFEKANESEWSIEFQLKTTDACRVLGISHQDTYQKAIKELVSFGAIRITQEAQGLYVARWISLDKCSIYYPKKQVSKQAGKRVRPEVENEVRGALNIKPLETTITKVIETSETEKENYDDDDVPDFVKKNRDDLKAQIKKSPPIAPPPPSWQEVPDILKNSIAMKEAACMGNQINLETFDNAVDEFVRTKKAVDGRIDSESDVKQHFLNWLPSWCQRVEKARFYNGEVKGKIQMAVETSRSAVDEIRRMRESQI